MLFLFDVWNLIRQTFKSTVFAVLLATKYYHHDILKVRKTICSSIVHLSGDWFFLQDWQILGSKCFGDLKCPSKMHFGGTGGNLPSSNIATFARLILLSPEGCHQNKQRCTWEEQLQIVKRSLLSLFSNGWILRVGLKRGWEAGAASCTSPHFHQW